MNLNLNMDIPKYHQIHSAILISNCNSKVFLENAFHQYQKIQYTSNTSQDEYLKDDPSYKRVFIWRLGLLKPEDYENEPTIDIRFYGRKYSVSDGMTDKFQTCMKTPIEVGDVLYDIHLSFYFSNNRTICHQNNLPILEYPCYDSNSTQYNSGESTNRQFTIGSSQHAIRLPCDENTCNLSSPKRFYLDKATKNPTSFVLNIN